MNEVLKDFPTVDSVQVLAAHPGDTIVITFKGDIGAQECQSVAATVGKMFPEQKVLVFSHGTTIEVIR